MYDTRTTGAKSNKVCIESEHLPTRCVYSSLTVNLSQAGMFFSVIPWLLKIPLMIKTYLKTAFRKIVRNKTYSIINMTGLATGIAVCLLIFMVIQYHSSFDEFHAKKDRIFRLLTEFHHKDSKTVFYSHGIPFAMPQGVRTAFPQVEQVAPLYSTHNDQVVIPGSGVEADRKFKEENGVFYTEPSFFKLFDFPLLAGSYGSLQDPGNVLLSKETAEKYFGSWREAMGRIIRLNNTAILRVSGVLATIPPNTDFQFKAVVAYGSGDTKGLKASTDFDGVNQDFGCYILLPAGVAMASMEKQLRDYSVKVKSPDDKDRVTLQPLAEIHYDTQGGSFSGGGMSRTMINVLWLIAGFILLMACVNFINLSTAQAVNRAKEVGVRKVLGSNRSQLRWQFLGETFLIVAVAVIVACLLALAVLPLVNALLKVSIAVTRANALPAAAFLVVIALVTTFLAGFYPSLVLSRFNAVSALKSRLTASGGISLRRGLVVFQFVIAQGLVIATLVLVKQMNYFVSAPIGFDKEAVVNIPLPTDSLAKTKYDYLRTALQHIPGVQRVSFSSNTPIEDNNDMWTTFLFNHSAKYTDFYAIIKAGDAGYLPVYGLPLVAGRNVKQSDTIREFLVNEMLLKNLGISRPEDALNKEIAFNDRMKGPIVGVLKDFNTRSFRAGLAPLVFTTFKNIYREASVKLATSDAPQVMRSIEKLWNGAYPDFVFEYKFLDDKIAAFYERETQLSKLYTVFACIAIFLSCLGLYGLASFMAAQRIKEVGIRKVLGASVSGIVYLFSKEFVLLIALAFAIATPVAWYFTNEWLHNFPYRTDLSWWLFIAGGIASIAIALVTVSYQAIRAASANPVKSLRTE